MKRLAVLLIAAAMATSAAPVASAATVETWGDFSGMFRRSAGQYFAGGTVAGQWAWAPQTDPTRSDISWGDPKAWPPASAERFQLTGDYVYLEGYSAGQGKPSTYLEKTTQEWVGDANCGNMVSLTPDPLGRQRYAKWVTPSTGYCLRAKGKITYANGVAFADFEHVQRWSAPALCSNRYIAGARCIAQTEQYSDSNGHPFKLLIDRSAKIAKGKGMAFAIHQTYPSVWDADGRYYWTY